MENLSEQQTPTQETQKTQELNEENLDKVSGGTGVLNNLKQGADIFSLVSERAQSILAPFAGDLNAWETRLRYRKVIENMHTYDTSKLSAGEKSTYLANQWNSTHPGENLPAGYAQVILAIDNEYDRAAIVCLPTVKSIEEALNQMFG